MGVDHNPRFFFSAFFEVVFVLFSGKVFMVSNQAYLGSDGGGVPF